MGHGHRATCRRCEHVLSKSELDRADKIVSEDGSKVRARLYCSACGWHNCVVFEFSEVRRI